MNNTQAKALFAKYIDKQCSAEEIELLDAFLDSYQVKESVEDLLKDKYLEESKDKVWQNIMLQVNLESKLKRKFPFNAFVLYAAAASLVLFLAITTFFHKEDNTLPTIVEQSISVGTDKATLTLEDGSDIILEKGRNYNDDNVDSDGEALVYQKEATDKKVEIVYNYLTIPRGGQFFVELSDGTKVWLNSESKLKYPVSFIEGQPRNIELVYGEAYFDVSPSSAHKGASFIVTSQGQNIEVLGTEFNVRAYEDETMTYTTLVEGKIALNTNSKSNILKPNEQAILNEINQSVKIQIVDVYTEISWKDGVFSFKGKTLKELTRVLSRWYDVDFIFKNKSLESMTFKGVLGKNQPIEDILNSIKNASEISAYQIKDQTIYIE